MNVTIERKKAPDCNTTATAISKGWHHRDDNTTVGGVPLNKSSLGSGKVDVFYYGPTATTKLDCTISSSSSSNSSSSSSKQLSQQQQQIRQHQQQQQQQHHHHQHHQQQHQLQSQQQHHQHQQHHHQQQQQQHQQYHQHHSHRHHHNTTISSSMDKYDLVSGYDFQNDNNNKIIQNVQQVISLQRSTPSSYLKRKLPVKNTTVAAVAAAAAAAATTTTTTSAAGIVSSLTSSSSLSSSLSSPIASTITTTSTTTITTTSTSSSFCNPSNNSNMSSTIRQHLDFSRGLRTDVTLVPPIRQTASIFKQPVTVFKTQDSKVKNDLKHGIIQDKPKQLFWVKRLEGLRACDLNGSEFNSIDLPKCIKPIGPNINEQTLLQSVATALHVTNQPVTGQNASKTSLLTNSGVFLNPDQPLMQSITINDDDIRRQEDRVNLARRRLQDALKA